MVGITRYDLPWPPSANTHWRAVVIGGRVRVLLSRAGRNYRTRVCGAVLGIRPLHTHGGRLAVHITLCPPDKRRIDIDNRVKPLLDAMTIAKVWGDDSQIDELHVVRDALFPGGRAIVEVTNRLEAHR